MSESRLRLPLIVAAFALAQAVCWGTTFNLPAVAGAAMAEALGLSYAAVMAGPTVMLVVMALAAVPVLRLFERWGIRRVMTAGVVVGALGLAVIAAATAAPAYFAGWLLVGAGGAAMLTTAIQIGLAALAGTTARRAVGALMVFGGLGTTLCWPVLGALQAAFGWRSATLAGAFALLAVAGPIYGLLLPRRAAGGPRAEAPAAAAIDRAALALLAFAMAANGVVTWGFSLTLIRLFEERGLDHATAVGVASFTGLAALSARLVDFAAGRRWNSLTTGLAAAACLPLSFSMLIFGSGTPAAIGFVTLYGLTSGVLAVARSTMPLDLFPAEAYARASSMLALPLNLSFACAPPLFAAILSQGGSDAALLIATGLSLAALAALGALVLRHRRAISEHRSGGRSR
ncbi:MFS transporter [Prosthecomicrobium pneumaticum]|uniref:Putative MFS family arabinose efflux permease n=1 Tax=Prosthecomicrobium pneumaticum TaxID=81895 RepID=A0A7W9L2C9_9HYPH|nr:MFS transporter [Prosthecomicrobium pneumaticum]MBB5753412.1 putative MFS family arabinose efflux permease [Prosthecomicrobium pneumaticum]